MASAATSSDASGSSGAGGRVEGDGFVSLLFSAG